MRLWNIGLDFGTAFTKSIVRNLATDEAFIVPLGSPPYFFPSEVLCGNGSFCICGDSMSGAQARTIRHLKMVLGDTAREQPNRAWLAEFARETDSVNDGELKERAEHFTAYFLARVIQEAKAFILRQTPDFDEAAGDRWMVNMAVPVAHAQDNTVAHAFERCLRRAWLLSREPNLVRMTSQEIETALRNREDDGTDMGCYIYPEVSANVQSYIKSRAGADGLYLFTDVGAGTVDLSVFIYYVHQTNDRPISYVSAGVVPLGSSQIEIRTAERLIRDQPGSGLVELREQIRLVKEGQRNGEPNLLAAMRAAEQAIEDQLFEHAAPVLQNARSRIRGSQWRTLKVLFGGGGADALLYRRAVKRWFEQFSFFTPEQTPIPLPPDLRWPPSIPEANRAQLFRRFSVAYGLSFDRANLEDHRFPSDVGPLPRPAEPPPERPQAPTMDEC
ncbi:MAG TPA: hypothetical protein P5038_10820 [Candidatus Paceibacterota bacterium]|nr:hypothetical protein [Candidatus Paceibacterota bacterium]HRT57109.1 hypothetical protein [Candidatus Paceibacterota bacterium]